MSKKLTEQSLKSLQKENQADGEPVSQKQLSGQKLPSLTRTSDPKLPAAPSHSQKSLKQAEAVPSIQDTGARLPSLKNASQGKLSSQNLRGKTDEELMKFIDCVYEVYRDNFKIEEIEEIVEETEHEQSNFLQDSQAADPGAKTAGQPSKKKKKVVRKVHKVVVKPFCPSSPFQLQGLIMEKMKEYNGLTDEHLAEFLNKNNRREILVRNGLLTEEGYIVCRPNEYLAKREVYQKIANLEEKPIRYSGKFVYRTNPSPYHNNTYQDYKQKIFKATNLHQSLVPVPPKKVAPPTKFDLMEQALAKQFNKSKKQTLKPIPKSKPEATQNGSAVAVTQEQVNANIESQVPQEVDPQVECCAKERPESDFGGAHEFEPDFEDQTQNQEFLVETYVEDGQIVDNPADDQEGQIPADENQNEQDGPVQPQEQNDEIPPSNVPEPDLEPENQVAEEQIQAEEVNQEA